MSWLYSIVFAGLLLASDGREQVQQIVDTDNASPGVPVVRALSGSDEIEKFEQTYPLSKNGNVSVSNVNGSITIEAWDREEVRLEATKIADSKDTLADVEIRVQSSSNSFNVEADYRNSKWNDKRNEGVRKLEVQFRLSVPRGAVLDEIETVNGSVTVSNFANSTKVSAVNGNVSATNLRGTASLSTVNGEVNADFDRVDDGTRIDLSTVNGQVNLTLPSDVNATVKADSLNGNISNDFGLPVRKGQYVGRDLYGRIGSGGTQIKLSSVNGNLSIAKKNDGRAQSPTTDLLSPKQSESEHPGSDLDKEERAAHASRVERQISRSLSDSRRAIAESMREAQKSLEKVGSEVERQIRVEELKKLEKLKIDIDGGELEKQMRQKLDRSRPMRSIGLSGMPTIERKRNRFPVKGIPKVTIDARGCGVSIRGWDKPEVQYVVTEVARWRGQPASVTESHDGSSVTLKIVSNAGDPPGSSLNSNRERVRVELFVPRKTHLNLTIDGEIRLDGISGEIELDGGDGSIDVRDVDGRMRITADQAQVRVIGFRGDLDSQTTYGSVFLEGDFKKLSAKATDGTVTLTLPGDANATLISNTEIESEGIEFVREDQRTWRLGKGGTRYNFDLAEGKLIVRSSSSVTSN